MHGQLVGNSDSMKAVRDLIDGVAGTDVTVLIRGERGTGKELVARAIHAASPRQNRPFVKVNCAAAEHLLEAELFGSAPETFSAAIEPKPGTFELAHQGTMFLDEIGELAAPLQSRLLRALQDGGFARPGGREDVRVDVRVVASTSRDLEMAVQNDLFREDLFFRLNVVCITLPPLRQRREEIGPLAEHFLARYAESGHKPALPLPDDTLRLLVEYEWPGNVGELEALVKRIVTLGSDSAVRREVAEAIALRGPRVGPVPALPWGGSLKDIGRSAAREAERELIGRTLNQTRWNRRAAAEILGVSYKALLYKIKDAELDQASSRRRPRDAGPGRGRARESF